MDELDQLIEEGAAIAPCLDGIRDIVTADIFEDEMAERLRNYVTEHIKTIEEASVMSDMLQATGVISKYYFRKLYEWRGFISERL